MSDWKNLRKLNPPWLEKEDKKAWYQKRAPQESLSCLKESLNKKDLKHSQEDKRLKNWDKWMALRKEQNRKFSHLLDRDPCELTMNSELYFRPKQEQRELIEYASNLKPKNKIRGGAEFWGFPSELKGKCSEETPLFVQQSKIEKGILPFVTKTGLSKIIKKEKDIFDETMKCFKTDFDKSEYKLQREKMLKNKMDAISPHRPDIEEMVIIGHRPKVLVEEDPFGIPIITFNLEENIAEIPTLDKDILVENINALKINEIILLNELPDLKVAHLEQIIQDTNQERKTSWSLDFICSPKAQVVESVDFQNLGTVVIKYAWRSVVTSVPYLKKKPGDSVFFFDKNEGILIPGEKKCIHFWYNPTKAQISTETWELITYPTFTESNEKLLFKLSGMSTGDGCNIDHIKSYINHNIALNIAEDVLNDIIDNFTCKKSYEISYEDLFTKRAEFNTLNPNFYYHERAVDKLKTLYDIIIQDSENSWNMSIKTLRSLIIKQAQPQQDEYFQTFQDILKLLRKPTFDMEFESSYTYLIVYSLLCHFANVFEEESVCTLDNVRSSMLDKTKQNHVHPSALKIWFRRLSTFSIDGKKELYWKIYQGSRYAVYLKDFEEKIYHKLALTIENMDALLSSRPKNL